MGGSTGTRMGLRPLALVASILLAAILWPLPSKAAVDIPDNPLADATNQGDTYKMHQAILAGQTVNDTDINYTPVIVLAVQGGFLEATGYLLANGARPDARARDGATALSIAAYSGRADLADLLLRAGANPDALGRDQDAPILIATRAHNTAIVQLLIKYKADLSATDLTGRSAVDLAEERHFNDILTLLHAAGAN